MEAVATATEREKARQAEIKKLQNETCFIGHPFGVGIVSFKYMMGSVTSYGFSAIFIYYLYAAAPQGLGLTQLEASQFITLDIALGSIFGTIGSYMADRVFGNRRGLVGSEMCIRDSARPDSLLRDRLCEQRNRRQLAVFPAWQAL